MTPPSPVISQFLNEHSTTSIFASPDAVIALSLQPPDLVTSLHPKYLYGPVDGVTGKVQASSFLLKGHFFSHLFLSLLRFSLLFISLLFSIFLSEDKKKKK
jgi:hypothetical protein